MGAVDANIYKKNNSDEGIRESMTAPQAARLDFLSIGIQDLAQLRDCNSLEGFLTALSEKGVRSRDYSYTLRKAPLAATGVVVVVPAIQ